MKKWKLVLNFLIVYFQVVNCKLGEVFDEVLPSTDKCVEICDQSYPLHTYPKVINFEDLNQKIVSSLTSLKPKRFILGVGLNFFYLGQIGSEFFFYIFGFK